VAREPRKNKKKRNFKLRNPIAKMLLAGRLLFKPKVVQSKKLYNRNEEKLYTLKVATKNYDKND